MELFTKSESGVKRPRCREGKRESTYLARRRGVLDAAKLYWTEVDPLTGARVPSKHPPTHALAVFEKRPSEPLLDDVIEAVGTCQTPDMRALRQAALNSVENSVGV